MTRSTFLKSTVAATGLITGAAPAASAAEASTQRAYFEIRKYTLKSAEKQPLLESYLQDAAIHALNRAGVPQVGVFTPEKLEAGTAPVLYVMLHHPKLDSLAPSSEILSESAVQQAGAAYLSAAAEEPVYERIESWLTRGIQGLPSLQQPAKGSQTYQLRIYESHSEKAAKKKIEMFNIGELAIFKRCGLNAVFFGETIVGPQMPNLTYLLAFNNAEAKDQAWNTFRADAEWAKLKTSPGFTDKEIVSRITNIVLVPKPFSQI